jgi:hypothetical protein
MRETIQIIDSQSGQLIDAEIFDEITLAHFIETQAAWRPVVLDAARASVEKSQTGRHVIPRHYHWDWTRKEEELKMLALKFYGLCVSGTPSGDHEGGDGGSFVQASRATWQAARVHRLH